MILNDKQRKIVIVGVVLFVLMGLFPPWVWTFEGNLTHSAGYALIVLPPYSGSQFRGAKIDISRLFVQWLVLAIATGFGVFLTRTQEKE